MVKSVVEEVIYGIASKIAELFKNEEGNCKYPIYKNSEEQGTDNPCFFIKCLNGEEKREIGLTDRFYQDILNFDIIGYTLDGDTSILHDMMDTLYELEYIEISDGTLLRAMKLHPEIEDGVLHFYIDYKIFIKKDNDTTEKMANYDFNEEVKKDESENQ